MSPQPKLDPPSTSRFLKSWGAELGEGTARFRLWAPGADALTLDLDGARLPMERGSDGWHELVTEARAGQRYAFVLPNGLAVPDPATRAQSGDVHSPSLLVDPTAYEWQHEWNGRPWEETVLYEAHVGTFTPEGTFDAMRGKLDHLVELGVTALELMPVAQFAGRRGWGYDGVLLYAPHEAYGTPDDLKRLVDEAHGRGLSVFLDVVYNHFGPDGNFLPVYAPDFFHPENHTAWGAAIAYDRKPVREFFIHNAPAPGPAPRDARPARPLSRSLVPRAGRVQARSAGGAPIGGKVPQIRHIGVAHGAARTRRRRLASAIRVRHSTQRSRQGLHRAR